MVAYEPLCISAIKQEIQKLQSKLERKLWPDNLLGIIYSKQPM